jgi:hypothetical protein
MLIDRDAQADCRYYRKKPVVIEAVRWTGDNGAEIEAFLGDTPALIPTRKGNPLYYYISIKTLEGTMNAQIGDWIIKGVKGEFYPCKPDIFEATYEPA